MPDLTENARSEQGDLLAELALADVEASADDRWLAAARSVLGALVRMSCTFTTDDVWLLLAEREVPPPHEPRAMGAVMRGAARDKLIVKTDRYVKSARPENHSRPIPVWRPSS